jgi:hypothetical protein
MKTFADIPMPSGVRRIADMLYDAVRRGLWGFARRGDHANAPAGERLSLLNRLARILRFAFLLAATCIDIAPARPRASAGRAPRMAAPRRAAFRILPRYRVAYVSDAKRSQPAAFARAGRDSFLIAQRKRDALLRALENPLPCIRRLARRLPTALAVIGWRPPKRPPPVAQRQYWDELVEGWREAWFRLRAWRRRSRDSLTGASA